MTTRRLLYVIGTRPEVVRSAIILRELENVSGIEVAILNTQQHYDANMMSDLWKELRVPAAAHTLPRLDTIPSIRAGQMIELIARLLDSFPFDAVAVYGDTDSSLAAAVAAAKALIPVIHIEAGCRSGDLRMQEELNRRLIDNMSDLVLAVSENCANNLRAEKATGTIVVTGDPQYDVFLDATAQFDRPVERRNQAFVTMHRSENIDNAYFVPAFVAMLGELFKSRGLRFIWPVHPRARAHLPTADGVWSQLEGISFVNPMTYGAAMLELSQSNLCITDSGGLQKEAFWLSVPCVTMRPSTEWVETVELGANQLVPDLSSFFDAVQMALDNSNGMRWSPDPYGGAGSAQRVAAAISSWFDWGK